MTTDQSQKEIEGYKEQIRLYKEQNRVLMQYLEEAKASREFLQKQLELHQEREKLSFLREQRDYQRIVELEKKVELLVAPEPQPVNTVETEEITPDIHETEPPPQTDPGEAEKETEIHTDYGNEEIRAFNDALKNTIEDAEFTEVIQPPPEPQVERKEPLPQAEAAEVKENEPIREQSTVQGTEHETQVTEETTTEQPVVEGEESEPPPIVPEKEKEKEPSPSTPQPEETSVNQSYLINEYFNKGLAAAEKNDYSGAIEAFTKVTTLLPDAAPSFLNLAILHFRMGNYGDALLCAQQAIERGSEPAKRLLPRIEAEIEKN